MKRLLAAAALSMVCLLILVAARDPQSDPRLKKSFRRAEQNGWTYVHLEGSPSEVGFQHGYLLAREMEDLLKVITLELTHDSDKDYNFYRAAAEKMLWPHVEQEYKDELQGIVQGANARGVKLDLWDVVVMNASLELSPYYKNWYDREHKTPHAKKAAVGDHCSAFVATGGYTKDGKIVIAHSNWSGYLDGERWRIIFDVSPAGGHHFLMDGLPGWIHSGDDFGVNAAGIAITETTITKFEGFDPNGIPEFVRARKAMQYSSSIDDFARIMKTGNNGGYANNWLVADRKTNEIASLELGLKNVTLQKTKDGYFLGTNHPDNDKLLREETTFDIHDMGLSPNSRRVRATELMQKNKGKIDVALGKKYLSDHYDSFEKKERPSERTLCGHVDLSSRGMEPWQPKYGPAGAVEAKVMDSTMAAGMSFEAASGHSCGIDFKAAEHIRKHPEFAWQKALLRDMKSQPWTTFKATF